MLIDRITKAFMFNKEVYSEVEHDTSFTTTAWVLVAATAFLSSLGSQFGAGGFDNLVTGIFGALASTVTGLIGFAIGAALIAWLGRTVFQAEVTFDELVRTLGLAYVWQAVGVLSIVGAFSPALACVTIPIGLAAAIAGLFSWFIAAKEALDLDWTQTVVTVILGWAAVLAFGFFATLILGVIGLGAAGLFGAFG
ncbi:MAG: YIP1 family protein [Anaerolineales bacterium]